MAWRSSGSTNTEMVENLKRFGVIQSQIVEDSFSAVDRKFFVPPGTERIAHADRPIREGYLHISAPHIYGTVLEAMDLSTVSNSNASFLNLGSGTGYLTCLVAEALGPNSSLYSVDLHPEVIEHAQTAVAAWQASSDGNKKHPHMEMIQGNALCLDQTKGEAFLGFDRIYVGAAMEREDLPQIAELLRPNGVLVGPVVDELVKVVRISQTKSASPAIPRSFRGRPWLSDDFTTTMLSSVRFSPLMDLPRQSMVIPSRVWTPSCHRFYPDAYRRASDTLWLCASAPTQQLQSDNSVATNAASLLPRALWIDILGYTHRDWFDTPPTPEELLQRKVQQLEAALQREQEAKRELEQQLRVTQGERDVYRQMARSWQGRLERLLASGEDDTDNAHSNELMFDRALLAMLQEGGDDNDDDQESEEEDDEDMDENSITEDTVLRAPDEMPFSTSSVALRSSRPVSVGSAHP